MTRPCVFHHRRFDVPGRAPLALWVAMAVAAGAGSARAEDWRSKKSAGESGTGSEPAELQSPLGPSGAESVLGSSPSASDSSESSTEAVQNSVQISLGTYLPWMNRFTRTTSGEPSPTGQLLPTVGAAYRFHWDRFPGFSFSGQGWFTPLGAAIDDGAGSTRWLSGALIAGFQEKQAEFRLGTGFLMQLIRGAGGTIELDNAGEKAVFYRPDRSVVGRVLYVDIGFCYQRGRWRYEADGMIVGLLSSRRAVGLVLQAGYGLF